MDKAQVGIASVWYEGNPCNMHLNDLADEGEEGRRRQPAWSACGSTPSASPTASRMGTDGMSYSLQSRDLIADSIETVMGGQWYDGLIALPGCDKNMPGCVMAMGRLNRPAIMVYGGTIRAGCTPAAPQSSTSSPPSRPTANSSPAKSPRKSAARSSAAACPGAGACGGMYTANTMASAIEALGMSLPYSSSIPAEDPLKADECIAAGKAILQPARDGPQAPRHHDPRGLRKRDDDGHGPRRLDQRRAAPHRHGPRRRRAADDRRLPERSATASPTSPTSSPAASTSWKTCTTSAARPPS